MEHEIREPERGEPANGGVWPPPIPVPSVTAFVRPARKNLGPWRGFLMGALANAFFFVFNLPTVTQRVNRFPAKMRAALNDGAPVILLLLIFIGLVLVVLDMRRGLRAGHGVGGVLAGMAVNVVAFLAICFFEPDDDCGCGPDR